MQSANSLEGTYCVYVVDDIFMFISDICLFFVK